MVALPALPFTTRTRHAPLNTQLSTINFPTNDILNKSTVLVLNRHWQAIHVKTPAEAFCMIATGAATALDVQGDDYITSVRWDDWLQAARPRARQRREHPARSRARADRHRRRQLRQSPDAPSALRCPR